jgi:UDP-N-acetylmuramoylalanine--D-glutamate ligase
MKIAILGFGREGRVMLAFARKKFKNAEFKVLDRKFDPDYLKKLGGLDLVFRTPGIPYNLPEIKAARRQGVEFSSATKIFFEEARKKGVKNIIGITGTKGKGTTSTILYKILRSAGRNVYLAGNIGRPAIKILPALNKKSTVILELSSFQLQDLGESPAIAVLLDIFPDHLDSHRNFSEYLHAKENAVRWQTKKDIVFYFSDNKNSAAIAQKSPGKKINVSSKQPNPYLSKNDLREISQRIKIAGEHNLENAVMAATIASFLGVPKKNIFSVIQRFQGNKYRLELARSIGKIKFYNDSGSTNPETVAAAVKSFSNSKILIAGGKDKNLNYAPLAKALKNSDTALVILFGENKQKIRGAISNSGVEIKLAQTLDSALKTAWNRAKRPKDKDYSIIFSPGSASFDMFRNYEERGKIFAELVKRLK